VIVLFSFLLAQSFQISFFKFFTGVRYIIIIRDGLILKLHHDLCPHRPGASVIKPVIKLKSKFHDTFPTVKIDVIVKHHLFIPIHFSLNLVIYTTRLAFRARPHLIGYWSPRLYYSNIDSPYCSA